jgi:lipopolysaccharide/colanic/teichoic acid biosynthesis glycosyltransferase
MTGPTALRFRREESLLAGQEDRENFYITQILPVKLEMDVQYVQTRSLGYDLRILTETAWLFSAAPARWALHRARHHRCVNALSDGLTTRI